MTLKPEIVTEFARFIAIRQAWWQLWECSGGYIFQHHDWLTGWLAGVQDRKDIRLHLVLVWDDNRLCSAMPCAVHRRFGVRILTWAAQLFSDYCDCLLDPACAGDHVLSVLWNYLWQYGGFDLISLQQIRPDARCRQFLDGLAADRNQLQLADREERCMRVENRWTDGEAFFRSLNKKARNNHTRGKRILTDTGEELRFRAVGPLEDEITLIEDILSLKAAWLRAHDPKSHLLNEDGVVQRMILNEALKTGFVRIFLLECGDKIAAASINFVYPDRMEAYLTAYDVMFERASPGTILIVDYVRWSFDRHLNYVDFLRGEEAFKSRLANAETLLSRFLGARTFVGQVAVTGHRWLTRRRRRTPNTRERNHVTAWAKSVDSDTFVALPTSAMADPGPPDVVATDSTAP